MWWRNGSRRHKIAPECILFSVLTEILGSIMLSKYCDDFWIRHRPLMACAYIHWNGTDNLIQNLFPDSKSDQSCYHFAQLTKTPTMPLKIALNTSVTLFSSDLPKMTISTDFIELNLNFINLDPNKHWALVLHNQSMQIQMTVTTELVEHIQNYMKHKSKDTKRAHKFCFYFLLILLVFWGAH